MHDVIGHQREKRESVFLKATGGLPGARLPIDFRVRNMSRLGARIDHDGSLEPDMRLILTIGEVVGVGARVVWVDRHVAGLRFERAVDPLAARKRTGAAQKTGAGWMKVIADPYKR